jgi:hypothetical protein
MMLVANHTRPGESAGPGQPVVPEREAERDPGRPHGDAGDRQGQRTMPLDAGPGHRRQEVRERGHDDQRHEAHEVEPGVGGLQARPGGDHRLEPGGEEQGQRDAGREIRDRHAVADGQERAARVGGAP